LENGNLSEHDEKDVWKDEKRFSKSGKLFWKRETPFWKFAKHHDDEVVRVLSQV